ncbi:MAG: H-NS histone family protein [Rhodobacteraceae bacterium]|jgi:DNA-binding protein H-NS|nr:H-NS histone family protein [Paracoccaceae bacterium]
MNFDLKSLSLKELKDLQSQVAREISGYEERQKRLAIETLEEKAREMGFSLAELTGMAPTRKKTTTTAKYANPANPADTWSGRGRKPRWYTEALAAGKSDDDMRV